MECNPAMKNRFSSREGKMSPASFLFGLILVFICSAIVLIPIFAAALIVNISEWVLKSIRRTGVLNQLTPRLAKAPNDTKQKQPTPPSLEQSL
jgi:hypothetical protein